MLSASTLVQLARLIHASAEGERKVEISRQVIANLPDFDLFSTFNAIDTGRKGYIDLADLRSLLEAHNTLYDVQSLKLLINSLEASDSISKASFASLVLPRCNDVLKKLCTSRINPISISYQVEFALVRLIEHEIEYLEYMERLKARLHARECDANACYRAINSQDVYGISRSQLSEFMKENCIRLHQTELDAIFNRWSSWSRTIISYSDFVSGVTPISSLVHTKSSADLHSKPSLLASPVRPNESKSRDLYSTPDRKVSKLYTSSATGSTQRSDRSFLSPEPVKMTESSATSRAYTRKLEFDNDKHIEILKLFELQISKEKKLDHALRELSLRPDFSLNKAFNYFDNYKSNYLTLYDFEDTLERLGVFAERADVINLMQAFDSDKDGQISYTDFNKLFTPRDLSYRSILETKSCRETEFSEMTVQLIGRVLRLHLDEEAKIEKKRQELYRGSRVNLHKVFSDIDSNRDSYLTTEELKQVLSANRIEASELDLKSLVQRYDSDKDGRVSYIEFVQEVTPKSPSKTY
mmetsp:Transcript_17367/g.31340  ORF Transcript_17367/g.31340 Transcript_17367/m.31340 type:complete len:526 (-) Transcript_17367:5392-6969(-)